MPKYHNVALVTSVQQMSQDIQFLDYRGEVQHCASEKEVFPGSTKVQGCYRFKPSHK